jgi:hypothetical protein
MVPEERPVANDPMNAQGEEETGRSGGSVDHAALAREIGRSTMTAGTDDGDDGQAARDEAEREVEESDHGPG